MLGLTLILNANYLTTAQEDSRAHSACALFDEGLSSHLEYRVWMHSRLVFQVDHSIQQYCSSE
jgi:hypothetical protein